MSNIEYFENKDKEDFWEDFSNLLSVGVQNNEYVVSLAANVISVCNIKFPAINNEEFEVNFLKKVSAITKRLEFKNCIFEGKIDISGGTMIDLLKFENCSFLDSVNISWYGFEKFNIYDSIFNNGLSISKVSTDYTKEFIIKNSTVKVLLEINECILSSARLYNVNFELATIKISDTIWSDIKMNNVVWGKKFDCNRDTFRQLKVVMEKHSNYIDANMFHSFELNEYRKELSKYSFLEKFEDKVLFNFNWAVSSFSTSWLKPLVYLILFSIVIYGGLCCLNCISECGINSFFEFFNPLSKKANDEYKDIYWIWFLHKVVSGFFLYHFVVAMKRSTKI